ncbi:UvrD-helicase domain-containing protein [Companilactobacillus sp. HBUAS59699]|uniref:UvrD-helicase domain-containing protein n=1 Tax=Companilactobacillus sp. HBUAS59699 TaxID=3109358 RepID=UPI002FF32F22
MMENDVSYLNLKEGIYEVRGAAGAGKTTKLVGDIKKLNSLKKHVAVISYSNAAIDELRSRIGNIDVLLSTIHSFCWKILRPISMSVLNEWKKSTEFIPDALVDCEISALNDVTTIKYGEIGHANFNKNSGELWLSHDDVIKLFIFSLDNIHNFPNIIAGSFDYILIDEYQDTNGDFLREVFDNLSKSLVVGIYGDPCQSVYLNKNIDPINIEEEKDKHNIFQKKLNSNFRSKKNLVDLFNKTRESFDGIRQQESDKTIGNISVFIRHGRLLEGNVKAIANQKDFKNPVILSLTNRLRTDIAGFSDIANKLRNCGSGRRPLDWTQVLRLDQLNGNVKTIWNYSTIFYGSDYETVSALFSIFSKDSIKNVSLISIKNLIESQKDRERSDINEFLELGLKLNPELKNIKSLIKKFTNSDSNRVYDFYDSLEDINTNNMTIFSAKGREFDDVILNIDYGFYHDRNWDFINFNHNENDKKNIESDIMFYLFYVGITRAKSNLAIYINTKSNCMFLQKFKEKFKGLNYIEL